MLQSLELVGFKSFADKTRFEFPAGVTVVVGPNGSGKSNVVDAIKWVLGSQSPKSLRGKEMTDVIFGGAGGRAPLNAAEVTLTFDNAPSGEDGRRTFDLDARQVRLTRRVYRSGEGEYLINGRGCRLKDFRELLAGTGVGAGSYSIIEQGRVDAALQASPLERRALLEEAAGISRYRLKKREADRRLERVEQNLRRLSDLVDEAEGRLRRVRSQAGKARKHREQTKRLREVRTELAAAEYAGVSSEDRDLEQQERGLQASLAVAQQELKRLEEAAQGLPDANAAEGRRRAAAKRVQSCRERLGRAEAKLEDATRRRGEATGELTDSRRELLKEVRLGDSGGDDRRRQAREVVAEAERALARLADEHVAYEIRRIRVAELAARVAERRDETMQTRTECQEMVAEVERRRESLAEQRAQSEKRQRQLEQELAECEASSPAAEYDSAVTERDAATEALARIEAEARDARRRLATDSEALAALRREEIAVEAAAASDQRRLESHTAEGDRVQRLVASVERLLPAGSDGAIGLVADLLNVDVDFAPMVEAALGAAVNHVVVDSLEGVLQRYADQPDALDERVCFESVEGSFAAVGEPQDLRGFDGVIGHAADFVEADPRHQSLVDRLLERCVFVESLAVAAALAAGPGRGFTFVTPACEVVHRHGGVSLGPATEHHLAMVREAEAETLREQIATLEQRRQQLTAGAAKLQADLDEAAIAVEQREERLSAERDRLSAALQTAAKLEERQKQMQLKLAGLRDRLAEEVSRHAQLATELKAARQDTRAEQASAAAERRADRLARWGEFLEQTLATEERQQSELREAEVGLRAKLGGLRLAESVAQTSVPASGEAGQRVAEACESFVRVEVDWLNLAAERSMAAWSLSEACHEERQSEAAEAAVAEARRGVGGAIDNTRRELAEAQQGLKPIELRRQQGRLERQSLADRMRDDYGIDLAATVDRRMADADWSPTKVDREALAAEATRLRGALQNAGPVNAEALDELESVETRHEQLAEQLRDLSAAKTSLVRLTTRINNDTRRVYEAVYEEVRGQFRELFSQLFGGGEADLVLTDDSDDPLERGVEIVASPPGKTLRNLSLLSGGEKTMTCVALLLAMFRSKPGPFCILDEVDAALDEANVDRFSSVIREFMRSTQFVVVTHSKRTMAAADTLYGVTMQQKGVSHQVSVRFEDVDEEGHVRLPDDRAGGQPSGSRAA